MQANKNVTVKRILDPSAPLTAAQKARLDALAAMPDAQIDYSDAPFVPDAVWTRAAEIPAGKRQITLRIDADVLDFFKHTGSRYQTRINAVLRAYVAAQKRVAPAK